MTGYEHRATVVVQSGTGTTYSLFIPGGIGSQLLVRANTTTTVFRVQLQDENSLVRRHWGFHRGEINDTTDNIHFFMVGSYAIQIVNASPDDTFTVVLSVKE